jgi:Flp pilus assembly protein TadD
MITQGQLVEAENAWRKAVSLKPDFAKAHYNLGFALQNQGRLDEAIACYRRVLELDPKYASAHNNLGAALADQGRLDEAIACYRRVLELDPKYASAHNNLGAALARKGQLEEAIACFQKALALNPKYASAHNNLGNALGEREQLEEAMACYRRALECDPKFAEPRKNLLLVERLAAGRDKLPAFLKGNYTPATTEERVALFEWCRCKKLYRTAAGLGAAALAADPKLAADLNAGYRYNAACSASLAGAGQGEDAGKLDEKERARLRKQALDWLRADLDAWRERLDKEPNKAGPDVQRRMRQWQRNVDLASVRDAEAQARLPEAERQQWQKLWQEVQALCDQTGKGR